MCLAHLVLRCTFDPMSCPLTGPTTGALNPQTIYFIFVFDQSPTVVAARFVSQSRDRTRTQKSTDTHKYTNRYTPNQSPYEQNRTADTLRIQKKHRPHRKHVWPPDTRHVLVLRACLLLCAAPRCVHSSCLRYLSYTCGSMFLCSSTDRAGQEQCARSCASTSNTDKVSRQLRVPSPAAGGNGQQPPLLPLRA